MVPPPQIGNPADAAFRWCAEISDGVEPAAGAAAGVWCTDASAAMITRIARSGVDWVCVDMQHGRYGRAEAVEIARTLASAQGPGCAAGAGPGAGVAPLVVRVPSVEFTGIGLALDLGARMVIVPQVDTAEDARRAVEAAFYPPLGRRSYGSLTPSWGQASPDPADANRAVDCAAMIESATALQNLDAIAAVDGVTMLFIGPFDLALSLGTTVSALLDAATDDSAIIQIRDAAAAHHLKIGVFAGDPDTAARFAQLGIGFIACATDSWLTTAGLTNLHESTTSFTRPGGTQS